MLQMKINKLTQWNPRFVLLRVFPIKNGHFIPSFTKQVWKYTIKLPTSLVKKHDQDFHFRGKKPKKEKKRNILNLSQMTHSWYIQNSRPKPIIQVAFFDQNYSKTNFTVIFFTHAHQGTLQNAGSPR